ncbi:MAG: ABC transporter substrate-binding protein, partial [Promethearchaeota archaeon]
MERSKIIAIVLCAIIIVGASVAIVILTQPTRPPIDWYVYETRYYPESFDPHITCYPPSREVIEQVYETLYTYPWGSGERGDCPDSNPTVPLLAASAPVISANGTVYTISLRQGITFHDGTPFNASVVEWNFKRAMKMFQNGYVPIEQIADSIKGGKEVIDAFRTYGHTSDEFKAAFETWEATDAVEASDTYEITFRLEEAAAFFIPIISSTTGCLMSPSFAEMHAMNPGDSFGVDYGERFTYMHNHTCGTGPYKVIEWSSDTYIHMTLNENYWRADENEPAIAPPPYAGLTKEIWFRTNEDFSSMNLNLLTGTVDDTYWPYTLADEIYDNITMDSKDPNIFFRTGGRWTSVVGFSFRLLNYSITFPLYSPFHWREIRNMMVYLFDYDAYIQEMTGGWAFRAEGPIPVGMFYQNSSYWTECYDPEIAVVYWNEAMQDPDFVDYMNTIQGTLRLYYPLGFTRIRQAYLLFKTGFDTMKLLPQMNTTGISYDVNIATSYIDTQA